MVTALARIEGKPLGIIANSTKYLGGAIDGDASEKHLGLCNYAKLLIFLLYHFVTLQDSWLVQIMKNLL